MSPEPFAASVDEPVPLTADEFIDVTRGSIAIDQLLKLDQFWTREAKLAAEDSPDRADRVRALGSVVDELSRVAVDTKAMLPNVGRIFESHASEIAARFAAIIDPQSLVDTRLGATLAGKHQDALRTYVERKAGGDVGALLSDAVSVLTDRLDAERENVADEFRRLNEGSVSDGDLSEEAHDAALAIEAGLAIAGQPELAILVAAGVEIADCLGL